MGSISIWHWALVLVVVLIFFGGRGKLSNIMGDAAQGIKAFKKGLADDDAPAAPHSQLVTPPAGPQPPVAPPTVSPPHDPSHVA